MNTDRVAPVGWHTVTPRLVARNAKGLVEFIHSVFEAEGSFAASSPTILTIGDAKLMVSEAGLRGAATGFLYVYVADADSTYARAMKLGVRSLEEPLDTPYGDRRCMFEDPWGNTWQVAVHGVRR